MDNIKQLRHKDIKKFRAWQLKRQQGICPICGIKITDPVLDHSHKKKIGGSGKVRKVVCRCCNIYLAKVENNAMRYGIKQIDIPRILRNIANYLEDDELPYIHPSEKPKEPKLMKSSYNELKRSYEGRARFPEYPGRGRLSVKLKALFEAYDIEPKFY